MHQICVIFFLAILFNIGTERILRTQSKLNSPKPSVLSIKLTHKSLSLQAINQLSRAHALLQHKSQYFQFHIFEDSKLMIKKLISFNPHVTLTGTHMHTAIPLKNYENTQFIGSLTLGTPGQTLPVIYDTGSSFTWINSERCNTINCRRIGTFNSHESKTFTSHKETEVFEFGSGKLLAQLAEETIELPGIKIDKFQFYEILTQKGNAFNSAKFAGIVGLGIADPDQEENQIAPLIDIVLPKLEKGLFSVYLSREFGPSSEIMIGGYKEEYQTTFANVDPTDYYWSIQLDDLFLRGQDGKDIKLGLCDNGCKVVLDTGTSYLTGPEEPLKELLKGIDVEPQCANFDKLPNLVYKIAGEEFELEPWEYTFTVDEQGTVNQIYEKNDKISGCLGAFIPLNLEINDQPGWILGDVFISKFPIVFDRKNLKIGIQKKQ